MSIDAQNFRIQQAVRDYRTAVAIGAVGRVSQEAKFGHVPSTALGIQDVWENGAATSVYVFPPDGGEAISISSASGSDTDILFNIEYLDAEGLEQNVDATLDGTNSVSIPNVIVTSVHRIKNISDTVTVGKVSVVGASGTYATAAVDDQQSSQAIYRVPSNKVALVLGAESSLNKTTGADASVIFRLAVRMVGQVFRTRKRYGLQRNGANYHPTNFQVPVVVPPGADIKITADASVTLMDVSAQFSMQLIDWDVLTDDAKTSILRL